MRRLRILLADDQPEILSLLQVLLEPDYKVVGTVEDGQSLIAAAQALRPDIILTDVDMPVLNGIAAMRELHQAMPDCRVIFHSSHNDPDVMAAAFAAGASGYLIKGSSQSLLSSIRTVVRHVWTHEKDLATSRTPAYPLSHQRWTQNEPSLRNP